MLDERSLADLGTWYIIFLFTLTIHEAAHALVAWWGGDDTAYRGGQVSLNPWPHIRQEPLGTVVIPIASYFFMGWTMGWASAPYNPNWGRRFPLRQAAMSAAGPAANLLMAILAFAAFKTLFLTGILVAPSAIRFDCLSMPSEMYQDSAWAISLARILSITLNLNLLLCCFNLFPLPPLDGSGILSGLFPKSLGYLYDLMREGSMFTILGILIAGKYFVYIYSPALKAVIILLYA